MMQNKLATALLSLALCTAAAADLDLSDFDTLLMQDMDAAIKDLEPLLGAKDAGAATATAEFLRDGLEWTERYFETKGNAADGVKLEVLETPQGEPSPDGPFLHSGRFFVVDGAGRVRGYYESADEADMARLLADLRLLAR